MSDNVKILIDESTGVRYRFAAIDGADLQPEPTPAPPAEQPTPAPAKRDNRGKPRGKTNETPESLKARIAAWEKGETQPDAIIQQEDGSTKPHSEIQEEKAKQGGGFRRRSSKTKAGKDRFVPLCDQRCLGTCMYTTKGVGRSDSAR